MAIHFRTEKNIGKVVLVEIDAVYAGSMQPRMSFNEKELQSLAQSIAYNGVIQPISVKRTSMGYEIIAGERRVRAAKIAGLTQIPCLIIETDAESSALLSLIENIQRENLNFYEEAKSIQNIIDEFSLTQQEVATRIGKSQSSVANKLRTLKIPTRQLEKLICHGLTERHARALLQIESDDLREMVISKIIRYKMTVAKTEEYIERVLRQNPIHQQKKKGMVRDLRLFFNTIQRAVKTMQDSGFPAKAVRQEQEEYIEYHIIIPKEKSVSTNVARLNSFDFDVVQTALK